MRNRLAKLPTCSPKPQQVRTTTSEPDPQDHLTRGEALSLFDIDRWRRGYAGLRSDKAKRMKDFERGNTRVKKLVAALSFDGRS
jgi:hypothetical protein